MEALPEADLTQPPAISKFMSDHESRGLNRPPSESWFLFPRRTSFIHSNG
jgi:hypothetical protein